MKIAGRKLLALHGLKERIKVIYKDTCTRKLFQTLPRYGERFVDTRTRSIINKHDILSGIEIFVNF